MAFYSEEEINKFGFKKVGKNVMVSKLAQIYKPHLMELGDYVRIDDFCVLSGNIKIGNFVHIAARSLIDGSEAGVIFEDYTGAAYNCIIIASSDSYRLDGFFGPLCLPEYRKIVSKKVIIGKYSVIGSLSIVLPGVVISEGCSFGAYSLVTKNTEPWSFYAGQPAKKIRNNDNGIIEMARLNTNKLTDKSNNV